MKICPRCGYADAYYWRPRIFDAPSFIDIALLEDLEKENPELAIKLKLAKPSTTFEEGHYVYKITRSGMVWRKERQLWKVEGWSIAVDGAGTSKAAKYKTDLISTY